MSDYGECYQVATRMLGGTDPKYLHDGLYLDIAQAERLCERVGEKLTSPQVIALIILNWITAFPGEEPLSGGKI